MRERRRGLHSQSVIQATASGFLVSLVGGLLVFGDADFDAWLQIVGIGNDISIGFVDDGVEVGFAVEPAGDGGEGVSGTDDVFDVAGEFGVEFLRDIFGPGIFWGESEGLSGLEFHWVGEWIFLGDEDPFHD